MVATARLAAGLSGLRNRNTRVTNKTQLRIVRGSVEADPIILDDDEEKNRILASQGVDEEDANEHHLQAALFASSQRSLATPQLNPANVSCDSSAYIPTPDAAGLVAEYESLYPPGTYKDPATYIRFSDSLDEACVGGLSGSFTYFLDERDAEWLKRNNVVARGEGTSASGGVNGTITNNPTARSVPRNPHSRSFKVRGKEPEHHSPPNLNQQTSVVVNEDQFELIMGLFEKWTDESVSQYLHLAPDPEDFPGFSNYRPFFSEPLPLSTFANFTVPPNLPAPSEMVPLAQTIYPWWKERRMERKGHRIIPQLHVLVLEAQEKEDKTGGSPYTCFRKRDVKPMRKTRTNNVTHTEKLTRLRGELQTSLELAQMVLQREKLKSESVALAEEVWRKRDSIADYMKRLNGTAPGSVPPGDELLLFDKEMKPRKPRVETTGTGRIILGAPRRPSHNRGGLPELLDPHSPLTLNGDTSHAFEQCQTWPTARTTGIQREVERELARTRKEDAYWEDLVDMPYQTAVTSSADRFFKPVPTLSEGNAAQPSSTSPRGLRDDPSHPYTWRPGRSVRLRTGRGGRLHLDRRLHIAKPHRLLQREWAGYPPRADNHVHEEAERWATRSWRPRNHAESDVRLARRERELGEEYWAHQSMHDMDVDLEPQAEVEVRKSTQRDTPYSTIGFEQSGYGWDTHNSGPRELWARARAGRDEEGWKPAPFLVTDQETLGIEVPTRNAIERGRMVEAWRGRTTTDASSSVGGGALALFTDGTGDHDMQVDQVHEEDHEDNKNAWTSDGRTADAVERAWRLAERWRHDSQSRSSQGQDAEDRFLLDDYQAKFMRTSITLLDAQDHEMIRTDPQFLETPPPKQNRYLDHQLRLQHAGLPQPSTSTTPRTPNPPPSRPMPIPAPPHPPPPSSHNGIPKAGPPLSHSPPQPQTLTGHPAVNGIANGLSNAAASQIRTNGLDVNGTNLFGLLPRAAGARLPPDSAATVLANTPMRPKQVAMSLPQAGLPGTFPNGSDAALNTHNGYPYTSESLKSALGRLLVPQQDSSMQQQQQQGWSYPIPVAQGTNGAESTPMNLSLGVTNLQLKAAQRAAQLRANGSGDNHGENVAPMETPPRMRQPSDTFKHPQQLALPRLPPTGTRTA